MLPTGALNAITDVAGVRVGHATVIEGDDTRTGVTAIIPQAGNLYWNPVPAWIHSANGYGKLIGETQVREFGEIETPILLTCTMCVWAAAEGLADYLLSQPGETEHTINPVVGETNDSRVNDMWADAIGLAQVRAALESASDGPVPGGASVPAQAPRRLAGRVVSEPARGNCRPRSAATPSACSYRPTSAAYSRSTEPRSAANLANMRIGLNWKTHSLQLRQNHRTAARSW